MSVTPIRKCHQVCFAPCLPDKFGCLGKAAIEKQTPSTSGCPSCKVFPSHERKRNSCWIGDPHGSQQGSATLEQSFCLQNFSWTKREGHGLTDGTICPRCSAKLCVSFDCSANKCHFFSFMFFLNMPVVCYTLNVPQMLWWLVLLTKPTATKHSCLTLASIIV